MKKQIKIIALFALTLAVFAISAFAQSSQSRRNPNAQVVNPDKPLKIVYQPEPELSAEQEKIGENLEETQKLRVEFLDSGFVGAITPLNTLPGGLTDAAIDAAGKIRFEAERKNTKAVTVYKIIEYSFKREKPVIADVDPENLAKAEAVIKKAVETLGGQKYLNVKTQYSDGKFSVMRGERGRSYMTFVDAIIYPDKEITEFKERGIKNVQANFGGTGWYYDGAVEALTDQTPLQIEGFTRAMRTNMDNFLRGHWRNSGAQLSYVGRRSSTLGKRNDVVKLFYSDGFSVEFEFDDGGFPMKVVYSKTEEGKEITEEDRFAQYRDVGGIKAPFVVDHFVGDFHSSRVNYENIVFNKQIPGSIFQKPASAKEAEKLKF
ncbi:MAG: hypothetical protein KIS76_17780 [Pyrinomonadaceae bacterium]|nr:hypothetical protein [Pyrinomonadaceae bacterium]